MTPEDQLIIQTRQVYLKFKRACQQVMLLTNCIEDTQTRYYRAVEISRQSFAYTTRLRLVTLQNIRDIFCTEALSRAEEMFDMGDRLVDYFNVDLGQVLADEQ